MGKVWENLVNNIASLINVRSIVTFTVVGVIAFLAVTGKLPPEDVKEIGLIIITFFFVKKADENTINKIP